MTHETYKTDETDEKKDPMLLVPSTSIPPTGPRPGSG